MSGSSEEKSLKTVVYQSYRRTDVPAWITRSIGTVKEWAALKGFDYQFIDDRLFTYVPSWYLAKVKGQVQLVADLARLELAAEFLSEGYERTIWIDADVLIFDPQRFVIDITEEYAFCREVWLEKLNLPRAAAHSLRRLRWSRAYPIPKVNNSVTVMTAGNSILDFYIAACKRLVWEKQGALSHMEVGTIFLTRLHEAVAFPLLDNVGLFSPPVMRDIATGGLHYVRAYIEEFGSSVRAANLCASAANMSYDGSTLNDKIYEQAVERLIETGGEIVNRHLKTG